MLEAVWTYWELSAPIVIVEERSEIARCSHPDDLERILMLPS